MRVRRGAERRLRGPGPRLAWLLRAGAAGARGPVEELLRAPRRGLGPMRLPHRPTPPRSSGPPTRNDRPAPHVTPTTGLDSAPGTRSVPLEPPGVTRALPCLAGSPGHCARPSPTAWRLRPPCRAHGAGVLAATRRWVPWGWCRSPVCAPSPGPARVTPVGTGPRGLGGRAGTLATAAAVAVRTSSLPRESAPVNLAIEFNVLQGR